MANKAAATQGSGQSAQLDFLILCIMSAVVPFIEANRGEMNKRYRNTLKRRIEKAVRLFVVGRSE